MQEILTFQDALDSTTGSLHLLLGNGFSRACRNDLFAYDALFETAKDKLHPRVMDAFKALDTTDFEKVMRALQEAKSLLKAYSPHDSELTSRLKCDAASLRTILANAIASNHPERSDEILDYQFRNCRAFLNNFRRTYTLNYDLLLYWALMKDDVDDLNLKSDDGFRQPEDGPAEYVAWDMNAPGQQNIFYMHGALHVFDAGAEVQKYTWSNTGIALIDQIREALETDRYPLYVTEGTSQSKLQRIMHSSYLSRGYRSLSQVAGSLFIYGHSLQINDEHVLTCIRASKIKDVYVSIFGDPRSEENQLIMTRAQSLTSARRGQPDRRIMFYDAASANVWD